jgi:hypothetical protein
MSSLRFPASILAEAKDIDTSIKNQYGCGVVEKVNQELPI